MKKIIIIAFAAVLLLGAFGCSKPNVTPTAPTVEKESIGQRINDFFNDLPLSFTENDTPNYGVKISVQLNSNPNYDTATIILIFENSVNMTTNFEAGNAGWTPYYSTP